MISVDDDFWIRLSDVSAFMWNGHQNVTLWLPGGPLHVTGERATALWSILTSEVGA